MGAQVLAVTFCPVFFAGAMATLWVCLAVAFLPVAHSAPMVVGAIKLDETNFGRALDIPGMSYLVKFDKNYAYGPKEEAFKRVSFVSKDVPNFTMVEVPVYEYGDYHNADFAESFGYVKAVFPSYRMFVPGDREGVNYDGEVETDAILTFIRSHGFRVLSSEGTIAEIDSLIPSFMAAPTEETVTEANRIATEWYSTVTKGPLYVKIMQKIQDKGASYVKQETDRMNLVLKGQLTPEKEAQMKEKLEVLAIFAKANVRSEL